MESGLLFCITDTHALLFHQTGAKMTSYIRVNGECGAASSLKETPRKQHPRLPSCCPLTLPPQRPPFRAHTRKAWGADRSWSLAALKEDGWKNFVKISPSGIMNLTLHCLNGCFPHAVAAFSSLSSPHPLGQLISEAAYWSLGEQNDEYQ